MAPETNIIDYETTAPTAGRLAPFDPKTPELLLDPYPMFHRYRACEPVHWGLSGLAGYAGAWYIFRHADAVAILRDNRFGKERRGVKFSSGGQRTPGSPAAPPIPEAAKPFFMTARNWVVHRDPPSHTRLRSLMNAAFTHRAVERMRPRVEEMVHMLLDRVADRGEMDFIADFAYPLPVLVITEMLGLPDEDRPRFERWSQDLQAIDLKTTEETWRQASHSIEEAKATLYDLIAERRCQPRDDLISDLVQLQGQGAEISDEELVANIFFLFFAGAGLETTVGFIGNGALALLQHPEQMSLLTKALVANDTSLMATAVDEMLRFESPVQMTNRTAFEDVEIGGQTIRSGDSVLVVLGATNRDPEAFPDPDRFDINRHQNRHHAFGLGPHYCLGAPLGRLEGEVAFRILLERLPNLALRADALPQWGNNAAIRSLKSLPVSF